MITLEKIKNAHCNYVTVKKEERIQYTKNWDGEVIAG